jgi:hypothetical protein
MPPSEHVGAQGADVVARALGALIRQLRERLLAENTEQEGLQRLLVFSSFECASGGHHRAKHEVHDRDCRPGAACEESEQF